MSIIVCRVNHLGHQLRIPFETRLRIVLRGLIGSWVTELWIPLRDHAVSRLPQDWWFQKLVLTDWNSKMITNVLAGRSREDINKVQETLCVTTYREVSSDIIIIARRYRARTMYSENLLYGKFSRDILFYPTNSVRQNKACQLYIENVDSVRTSHE